MTWGPYDTEDQAAADAVSRDPNQVRLEQTCTARQVRLGAYDRRILTWLAGWEPPVVQVVCGLVDRAYQAGQENERARHLYRDHPWRAGQDTNNDPGQT